MTAVLGMILAGGEGSRLRPLTESRSKPSVPFGGSYRLVDFALNNFVNADFMRLYVLTQFKSQSLNSHLSKGWMISGVTSRFFIEPIPAQMRTGKRWYEGTADAIYQNLRFMELSGAQDICIFGSDHIYKMDIRQMMDFHRQKQAKLTVSAIRMPVEEASQFGVIEIDEQGMMVGFEEKPQQPKSIPGLPGTALVSMGNYIFKAQALYDELNQDAEDPESSHDFGNDIIPKMFPRGEVYVYDFSTNVIPGEKEETYWRDVGTIDAYWQAHMDLLKENPPFSLYNRAWPLHTYQPALPPATYINSDNQNVEIVDSLVCNGSWVRGSQIKKSVLGFRTNVASQCDISESIFLGSVKVGEGCILRRVIVDKDVEIAPGTEIGVDLEQDKQQFHVSDGGIVVIPKGAKIGY